MSITHPLEARAVSLDPGRSIVIEACAGSGKTWLLVSRILRLLLDGTEPGEILAITFTRQAAQEMVDRLHQWLRMLATQDDETVRHFLRSRALPEAQIDAALDCGRGLYERVLQARPALTIATFHGWFLQLLRAAPLDSGSVGSVTLIERTSALQQEAWGLFAEQCQRDADALATRALDELFRRYGLLNARALLLRFVQARADWWAYAGLEADAVERALAQQAAELTAPVGTDVYGSLLNDGSFRAEVREWASFAQRNAAQDQTRAQTALAALDQAESVSAFLDLSTVFLTRNGTLPARKPSKAQAKRLGAGEARFLALSEHLGARLLAAIQDCADQASYRANAAAMTAGVALLKHYQQVKQDRQVVDFADVEWLACQLLARGEHAVAMHCKLDSRYRHILLDEFQDTNPLQWLALRAWFEAAVQAGSPPRVFVVGDPKQAIFRFRRADARLFDAARDWLRAEHGAAVQTHDESRRCAQPVLDVVNRLFSHQPQFAPFTEHVAHGPARVGRVEVLPLACSAATAFVPEAGLRDPLRSPRQTEEDDRRQQEALQLVAKLAEIVGQWEIEEPATGKARRARYGDVLILVRRRTHLQVYERALRYAGMPFVTSRQGGLLDTLEVEDLLALLEFLVAPFDDLKLAHALRSPIFGCGDDDMMAIAQAPGASWWDRLQALPAARERTARARQLLGRWLQWVDRLPVHDTLDRIYFEGELLRRYQAGVAPAMRAAVTANLDAFIQRALEVDSGRYPSLPRFLAELRGLRTAPADEAPDEGEVATASHAIRIMTVHGAKGLEAPLVWLLDAAAPRPADRGFDALVQWEPGECAPASFSLLTLGKERSRAQRRRLAEDNRYVEREEMNLLYVAMTRARQVLIVSGCEPRRSANSGSGSWYGLIRTALLAARGPGQPEAALIHGDSLLPAAEVPISCATPDEPSLPQPAGAALPAGGGGGQLAFDFDIGSVAEAPGEPPDAAPVAVGRRRDASSTPGQRYGSMFHLVMQHASAGGAGEVTEMARRTGLPAAALESMWAQARALMVDPELARFFDPRCFQRALNEWPLVTASGELRRVDRMIEFADEVWVLDYKTGGADALAGSDLECEYRAQIETYCDALRSVFHPKIVRGLLLFADGTRIGVELRAPLQV